MQLSHKNDKQKIDHYRKAYPTDTRSDEEILKLMSSIEESSTYHDILINWIVHRGGASRRELIDGTLYNKPELQSTGVCTCPTYCDCEHPPPKYRKNNEVYRVSNSCPIHNDHSDPDPDCPIHGENANANYLTNYQIAWE